ncbi:MAG: methylated-DNA--[protein]-cysteine S-methyltransferase [Candidatus Jettenia sp. CY-1]|nr:methylated-DNA--[protein]-cysteine S-methyltransferase [Candidatus Jettenia sp.]WKZ17893.1 MAG: methylated-DNA--[protein]-cysteine S-methyltransferase [Candidatus Jettenia sp. CY-1]
MIPGKPEILYFSSFQASVGHVYIAKSIRGVCRISFPCSTEEEFLYPFLKNPSAKIQRNNPILTYEIAILREYFEGKQVTFDFVLDVSRGTVFQRKVWSKLQEIPYGQCQSYKWVAEQIGSPKAARAVGLANNKNPLPPVIPCHRVIGSNGSLTGYAAGLHIKKQLLEMEYNAVTEKKQRCKARL